MSLKSMIEIGDRETINTSSFGKKKRKSWHCDAGRARAGVSKLWSTPPNLGHHLLTNKVLLEHNHDHMFINSVAATAAWLSHCNKIQ